MFTYQDFLNVRDVREGVRIAIEQNKSSEIVMTAVVADEYDRQKNVTISSFMRMLYTRNGAVEDRFAANHKICSNFFRHLNTQRMAYSLGNGVTFMQDGVKERLGVDFDTRLRDAGYYAIKHGVSFMFFNVDRVHVFPVTEFAPLWDEETGALMAGVRYWQIDPNKPMQAVLYERDGFTRFRSDKNGLFVPVDEKRAYRMTVKKAPADAEAEVIGENYGDLPIVPLYGSRLKQSTLVGMRGSIDAYDLILSGFANDLSECSEIYWIVSGAGGMDDGDLARFRDRLKTAHIANVMDSDETKVTPYTQEIPHAARKEFLDTIRAGIYENYGGLDVHSVEAGSTNDHLEAAYQPMDENADDFEYQVIECVQQILRLIGVEDTPQFKRNRISNEAERTNMILSAASYLDDETVLSLLPFITPDMVDEILARRDADGYARITGGDEEGEEDIAEVDEGGENA